MEISDREAREFANRIMKVRMHLLLEQGFYGMLLTHLKIGLSDEHETAWTDWNDRILFNPKFLNEISDRELEYALVHVLLHIILEHTSRMGEREKEQYEKAADIVVNSNILKAFGGDETHISLKNYGGVQAHKVPGGGEGHAYTVEEVYKMLKKEEKKNKKGSSDKKGDKGSGWDYHEKPEKSEKSENISKVMWAGRLEKVSEALKSIGNSRFKGVGSLPLGLERFLTELKKPQVDWRTVLNEFIQMEVMDYTFSPPDRRYDDSPFFLPDYNLTEDTVMAAKKILFMVDTSGSMSEDQITQCYSEIKGAIDQYNGRLEGWLGFFDAAVVPPKKFDDEEGFKTIHPAGGGGTSFHVIFNYVRDHMKDELPTKIVILTDGYAPYPKESAAMDIPVLWIINNEGVDPPWGKVVRIESEEPDI